MSDEEQHASSSLTLDAIYSLFEASPVAHYLMDLEGTMLYGNGAAERLIGYKQEELVGKNFTTSGILSASELTRALAFLARIIAGSSDLHEEMTFIRKDGALVQVMLRVQHVRVDGKHLILGIAEDITEQRRLAAELTYERDRLREYLNIASDLVVVLNVEGKVELINPHGAELLGKPSEAIIGVDWFSSFIPNADEVHRLFTDLIEHASLEKHGYVENLIRTASGEERLIAWRNSLLKDASGTVIGTVSAGDDITEVRALMEEQRSFMENVPGVFYRVTPEGVITYLSPQCKDLFGVSAEELKGKPFKDLIHAEDAGVAFGAFRKLVETKIFTPIIIRTHHSDGSYRHAEIRAAELSGHAVIGMLLDVTGRMQSESRTAWLASFPDENPNPIIELAPEKGIRYLNASAKAIVGDADPETHPLVLGAREFGAELNPHSGALVRHVTCEGRTYLQSVLATETKGQLRLYSVDITQQQEAERAVRASEEQLLRVINAVNDPIFVKNRQHAWMLVNDVFCEFIGHPRETLIGKGDYEFFPKEQADVFWAKDEEVFTSGQDNTNEEAFTDASGVKRTIITKKRTYKTADGQQALVGVIRDITDRVRSEDRLREQEALQRAFFDGAKDPTYLKDAHSRYIIANPALCAFFSKPVEEVVGKVSCDLMPTVLAENCRQTDAEILAGSRLVIREVLVNNRYLEVRKFPVALADGTMGIGGYFRDITEVRQAQEDVRRARDFQFTLLEEFPMLIWRSDATGKCTYFNKTWLVFTGRTLVQEMGDGWTEGVHPEDRDRCVRTYQDAFAKREPFSMEYRLRRVDGEYRWIVDNGRAVTGLDGAFAGYIGSCYDVTDRRLAEIAMTRSEARYRTLVDAIEDFVYAYDSTNRFTAANPSLCRALGRSEEEIIGKTWVEVGFTAEEAAEWTELHRRVADERSVVRAESKAKFKDGRTRIYEITLEPLLDAAGAMVGIVGVSHDITERKRVELTLFSLNECFASFTPDSLVNVKRIIETAGNVLGGTCLYNRIEGEELITIVGHNLPEGFAMRDAAKGHVCTDVVYKNADTPSIIPDLQSSSFAETDPNVRKYGLHTYIGGVARVKNVPVGTICCVFNSGRTFEPYEVRALAILAQALGIEEERRLAEERLAERRKELERMNALMVGREVRMATLKRELAAARDGQAQAARTAEAEAIVSGDNAPHDHQ